MDKQKYVLDFSLNLGDALNASGSTLERVKDSIYEICELYDCQDVQLFALSSYMSLSMKDEEGNDLVGQKSTRSGLNLKQLSLLDHLRRQICREKPDPEELSGLLDEVLAQPGYPTWVTLLGFLLTEVCLAIAFGANPGSMLVICLNTVLIFVGNLYMQRLILNQLLYNVLVTFVIGSVAIAFWHLGVVQELSTVFIVNSLILIPGIALVNSVQNLLCGNDINGVKELLIVILDTLFLVGGYALAIFLFGGVLV